MNGKHSADRAIIFRDGVGEGQKLQVVKNEISHIKKVLSEKNNCQLMMIVVNKRISQRFYENVKINNNTKNIQSAETIKSGLVVDNTVVLP